MYFYVICYVGSMGGELVDFYLMTFDCRGYGDVGIFIGYG